MTRFWRCTDCGRVGVWGPGWRWYGSLSSPQGIEPNIERVQCPACHSEDDQ